MNFLFLQDKIDSIIKSDKSKVGKIKNILELCKNYNVYVFVDFDDTITNYFDLFYSKFKVCELLQLENKSNLLCKQGIFINKKFLYFLKNKDLFGERMIILSRNNHGLLKNLLANNQKIFAENNINIVGVIGSQKNFLISSEDKKLLLKNNNILITDMFEGCKNLYKLKNVCIIDELSFIRKNLILLKKIFILLIFILFK